MECGLEKFIEHTEGKMKIALYHTSLYKWIAYNGLGE